MAELSTSTSSSDSFDLSAHPPHLQASSADSKTQKSQRNNQEAVFDVDVDDDDDDYEADYNAKANETTTNVTLGNPSSTITNEDNGINNTTSLVSVTNDELKSFSCQVSD